MTQTVWHNTGKAGFEYEFWREPLLRFPVFQSSVALWDPNFIMESTSVEVLTMKRLTWANLHEVIGVPGTEIRLWRRVRSKQEIQANPLLDPIADIFEDVPMWLVPAFRCEKCNLVFIVGRFTDLWHDCMYEHQSVSDIPSVDSSHMAPTVR